MSAADPVLTTRLLNRFAAGDASLEADVVERIHGELRQLAEAQLARGRGARSLDPTALVHEAWLRLVAREDLDFGGRRQFFRFAGKLMRNLLIDRARAAEAARRDRGVAVSGLGLEDPRAEPPDAVDALDLADAIERLENREPELARVVELRLLCGLSNTDVAEVLECSVRTVERRWRFARAWLVGELELG